MQSTKRAGSRHLLPIEMYLGIVAISWAVSGGFGTGYLRDQLLRINSSSAWFFVLMSLGLAQLLIAATEFTAGGTWPMYRIWRTARLRTAMAFLSILIWVWVCKLLWDFPYVAHAIFVLVIMAPVTVVAQGWVFVENFKVRLAADEKIPTDQTLRFGR